jgi:hypothetical protein
MNNTDTLSTSDTQDTRQNKHSVCLCCSFLIVPFVYSSVYFVLCLVYPMLSVSLCCSFLIVPFVYSSVYFVLYLVHLMLSINTRVNRRDNQEWTTKRHWQYRIHKTRDKINTRVNRRDNFCLVSCASDVISVSVLFILDCPFCLL